MDKERTFWCKGIDHIQDSTNRSVGISEKKMNLFDGTYTMGSYVDGIMIRKVPGLRRESFDILKNYNHPSVVPLLNFYCESSNMSRFVIPKQRDSFKEWFELQGKQVVRDENGLGGHIFRNIIIDLCDVVEDLHSKNIILPDGIAIDDLYIKESAEGVPKVLLLMTKVEKSKSPGNEGNASWRSIKGLIDLCCKSCDIELDSSGILFRDFIGGQFFSVKKLRQYPDKWNWETKGEYLLALKSARQNQIRTSLKATGICWPQPLPEALNFILEESAKQKFNYNKGVPFDYLQVLWNAYKHYWTLHLNKAFDSPEAFVMEIERWTPLFWIELYQKIGWP